MDTGNKLIVRIIRRQENHCSKTLSIVSQKIRYLVYPADAGKDSGIYSGLSNIVYIRGRLFIDRGFCFFSSAFAGYIIGDIIKANQRWQPW